MTPAKRAAARAVDLLLGVLAPVLVARRPSGSASGKPRVLVIRADHIGDAVMATPILRPLRQALDAASLDVLAGPWAAPIFRAHPAVDEVLDFTMPWWGAARGASRGERVAQWLALPSYVRRVRAGRYDIGIDLRGDLRQIAVLLALGNIPVRASSDRTGGRRLLTHVAAHDPALHEVEKNFAIAALFGARNDRQPQMASAPESMADVRQLLGAAGSSAGYAVLALRGSAVKRSWTAAQAAVTSERLLRELGLESVYVGAAADRAFGDEVARLAGVATANLAGRTTLAETEALMRHSAVTIAVDSGPMHLAAAAGARVVALFGPGDPRHSRPWTAEGRSCIVGASAPCGCIRRASCDHGDGPGRCMREITSDSVIDAVRTLLADAPSR